MKTINQLKLIVVTIIVTHILLTSCDDEPGSIQTIKPLAEFSVSAEEMEAEQKIIFTSSSSDEDGFVTSYEWSLGDGTTASGQKVEHF